MRNKAVSIYLAAAAAVLAPIIPALPDTLIGSPRAIAIGLEAGLLAGSILLRGGDGVPPAKPA